MLVNHTIFGKAPFRTTLVAISVFLTILFTLMEPVYTQTLTFFPRLLFWLLQVSTGMLGIVLASLLLRPFAHQDINLFVLLLMTGFGGALLASPGFALIDVWYPGLADEPDSWLDEWALQGPLQAIAAEFLDVSPSLVVSWFLVNLPLLLNATFVNKPPPPDEPIDEVKNDRIEKRQTREQFFDKLPEVIGKDIVSISSDLHYLNVTTTLGSSLILGSLSHIAEALEDDGFLVHRSHWVSKLHVVKVHIAGSSAYCLMSNQNQIPISRSKRKLLKSYFGQGGQNSLNKDESGQITRIRQN